MGTSLVKFNRESNLNKEDHNIMSKKFDVVGHLPPELCEKIFLQLSSDDLRSATLCCLKWKAALSNEYIWKRLCRRDGCFEVEKSKRSEFYNNFLERYSYWQGVYWYNQTLQRNWETNNYREVIYELDQVYCFNVMLERWLYDDVFVCTNRNWKKLYIYNLKNKEFKPKVFSLPARSSGCFAPRIWKSGKYLIYLHLKAGLIVWDLENGSVALDESWDYVIDIRIYKNLFVLETSNDKFEVLNIETGEIEYECNGIFMNVDIIDGTIVYTTTDHVIHMLKWEDKSSETLTCCNDVNDQIISIKDDLLLSFCARENTSGTTLCAWNLTNKTKLYSVLFDCFVDYFNVRFMNRFFILINYDHFNDFRRCLIELWDYTTGIQEATVVTTEKRIDVCFGRNISNDYVMAVPRSSKTSFWCLKTKSFVWDVNSRSWRYKLYDLEITKTKLAYAIGHSSKIGGKSISLRVRDFEI